MLTEDKVATYYNKVTVIVSDESGEVFNATVKIPDGSITSVTLTCEQTDDASQTIVKSFDVCTDNGFNLESASPYAYETDVVPCDAEFVFSNAISEIKSVTLNDVPVEFEYTSEKSIKLNIASLLEYNKKYVINITGAKDKFGETKDFKHTFYTVYASSLSDISIKEGERVEASVKGFSHDGNKYTYALVLASFDSQTGKLINIKKTNVTLGANTKDFSVAVPKTDGAYYEAYVWDSVKGMVAIKNKASHGTNSLDAVPGKDGYVQNMDTLLLTATNTGISGEGRNTLLILKPGKNMNDIVTDSDLGSVVEYIGQFDNADKDVYAFTPSEGGKYGVAINGVFKSNAFTYIDGAEIKNVFTKLNEEITSFVECINNYNDVLKVDMLELSSFDSSQKARLQELITQERAKLSEGFKTCEEFATVYDYAVSRVVIETAKDAADIKTAFEKYGAGLGMKDFVAYNTYETVSDEGKNAIYADIAATDDFSTVEKIENAFATATILRAVQYAENYVDINKIINNNNDYLKFNLSAYNSLKKQSSVNKALAGNYYQTISGFGTAFDNEVSKQKAAEANSGDNSGGYGGNSSGSSKGFGNSGLNLGPVVAPAPTQSAFTDLGNHVWAKEAIDALSSKGIISGRSKTVFDPSANITREEFTKIIVSAFTQVDNSLECNFSDVSKDAWYYSYIATAQRIGLITGTSATTFGTGEKITRQDMATILYRACEIFGTQLNGGTLSFADSSSVSDYAKQAVASLCASGIINGKGNNNFEPLAFATRAESAKMVYETLERGDK